MSTAALNRRRLPVTAWGFSGYDPSPDGGGSGFKRILLAVTHSGSSRHAVAVVAALAHAHASEVFVIHLSERLFLGRGGYWDLESPDDARQLITEVRTDLERLGVQAETWTDKSVANVTPRRIVDAAVDVKADLIVIGRPNGKSSLWGALRGCVSHGLVHGSRVPVLVVPETRSHNP